MTDDRGCVMLEPMDAHACVRKLASRGIGRLAVVADDVPLVVPVNYAWVDGAVVFATDDGTKAQALSTGRAAFEIDEIDGWEHTGWSVLVVGHAAASPDVDPATAPVVPWCGATAGTIWMRLVPEQITGRRITRRPA